MMLKGAESLTFEQKKEVSIYCVYVCVCVCLPTFRVCVCVKTPTRTHSVYTFCSIYVAHKQSFFFSQLLMRNCPNFKSSVTDMPRCVCVYMCENACTYIPYTNIHIHTYVCFYAICFSSCAFQCEG
eukprot:GHVR01042611.1.p1 GENE.GHVR01042611.1~~GHVR01042611.1.p1  ORF type:complete len:126 (+),score=28.36 GHVR01042611.1:397-774(+)